MMEEVPGAMGTSAGLALRLGQTIFSTSSLLFMCLDINFYGYTAFWQFPICRYGLSLTVKPCLVLNGVLTGYSGCSYLVTVMGLVIPWSTTLVVVDAYSVFVKSLPLQPRILLVIITGDWVLSFLSLAAATSTASFTDLLLDASNSYCPGKLCSRYQLSAAMAFLCWFLAFASALFNLWLLPSL